MKIKRMEHVGIVVEDLPAAIRFFTELGLILEDETPVTGRWVDRIVGLEGVHADIAIMRTDDGHGRIELTRFNTPRLEHGAEDPAPANAFGIRHISFAVTDIDDAVAGVRARGGELVGEVVQYEDSYRLCYLRGPEGIIVELAQRVA